MNINSNSLFYHIYPLGACDAPRENDFSSAPVGRLDLILPWLDHIQGLGFNALYLGPVFESSTHGYDTANYYEVDRRLGTRENLRTLSRELHRREMSLVLDGVFNHVGRQFWAFRHLQDEGQSSLYRDWFAELRFDRQSPLGDPFSYRAWNGHFSLVNLNLENPAVRAHLFGAIAMWKEEFAIDGIRLDAADALSISFIEALAAFCNALDPQLWLMGEVIHGDYRNWAQSGRLHATTNYELYKSLWSSLNDGNFFELAHSLQRQFGAEGIYRHLNTQYTFLDNHDVSRIASQLHKPEQLAMLYSLLFACPGLPSLYYGSEYALKATKSEDDWNLRPSFSSLKALGDGSSATLPAHIATLCYLRQTIQALREGDYAQCLVASRQLAFTRSVGGQCLLVVCNSDHHSTTINLSLAEFSGARFRAILGTSEDGYVNDRGELCLQVVANSTCYYLKE